MDIVQTVSDHQSFAYVNARFWSLMKKIEEGDISVVNILNTAGSDVVAKIVTKDAFDAALAFGGCPVRVVVPQIVYSMVPQRVGYDSLYRLVKELRDDNRMVENGVKASLTYTQTVGPDTGSILFEAKGSGVVGNSLNISLVKPGADNAATTAAFNSGTNTAVVTLHRVGGVVVATLAEIAATVVASADALHMTALASGVVSMAKTDASYGPAALTGGEDASLYHSYIAYDVTRAFLPSRQAGLAPSAAVRAVMLPKALADQLSL